MSVSVLFCAVSFWLTAASSAAPHTPMLPTGGFVGRTTIGPYGDFVAQTDAAIGSVLDALAKAGIADRTPVIVASDNGPAPAAGIEGLRALGHDAAGGWRGAKHGLYEGGHRVPFIVRWPGVVAPGRTTARTMRSRIFANGPSCTRSARATR